MGNQKSESKRCTKKYSSLYRSVKLNPKKSLERSSFKNGRGPQFGIFDPMAFKKPHKVAKVEPLPPIDCN